LSVIKDAERFLHLHGVGLITSDDPIELVTGLIEHFRKFGLQQELVSRNAQLTREVADLTIKLREQTKKHLAYIAYLEDQLSRHANCQTSAVGSASSVRAPELESDLLSDPQFVPCRDERCGRRDLHAQGSCKPQGRGPNRSKKDTHA